VYIWQVVTTRTTEEYLVLSHVVANPSHDLRLTGVASRLGWAEVRDANCAADFAVEMVGNRLVLRETGDATTLIHQVDIDGFIASQKSFPTSRKGALNQAVGRRTVSVIDATGGWGGDSLLLCSQGYQVSTIERVPVLALFLDDAFRYLSEQDWVERNGAHVPVVIWDDARQYLASHAVNADCIYIDPMFPPKRKESAAVNKTIRMLQKMCGSDPDAHELLDVALLSDVKRVVVKRPVYAEPIGGSPTEQFFGKLVRYDLYMP
jgi:16S rRNA (guanine1516-N2)-methyltransferase